MTTHPDYPPDHHSVQECRELGLCWHCQTRKALKREFEGMPCCSRCKKLYKVEVT